METLTFYSYTGGVGRSQFLADTARFLASRGKAVAAIDLNLEAPVLHYKLGCKGWKESHGGAVPYLLATAEGATPPPPLEEHMVEVPTSPGSGGSLLLMPAGPAPERPYWTALKQLREQLRLDDPSGQGLMSLLDLHARIEEELKPDYLLLDVRTGVTELGGIATTVLANTVVCMFEASEESVDGTLRVIDAMKVAPRLRGQNPLRIMPVLAGAQAAHLAEKVKRQDSDWQSYFTLGGLLGILGSASLGSPGKEKPRCLVAPEDNLEIFHTLLALPPTAAP